VPRGRIIGLTGKYCAGKNYAARMLEARGFPVLDVDKLGYTVIENEREAILARFGPAVLGAGGAIDRRRLGALVFGKPDELAALEGIIHPGVNRMTEGWIRAQGGQSCVINAALLHRSSAFEALDAIILVKAPFLIRIFRARKRDRLPWTQLLRRFKSQRNFDPQYFQKKTDIYSVFNSWSSGLLERRLDRIISRIGMVQ
jgi:dephospho-CoA kinase